MGPLIAGCAAHLLVGTTVNIIVRSCLALLFALSSRLEKNIPRRRRRTLHTVMFLRSVWPTPTIQQLLPTIFFLFKPSSSTFFFHFPFSFWISIACKTRICELLFIVEVWKEFLGDKTQFRLFSCFVWCVHSQPLVWLLLLLFGVTSFYAVCPDTVAASVHQLSNPLPNNTYYLVPIFSLLTTSAMFLRISTGTGTGTGKLSLHLL